MKKNIFILVSILLIAALLAGCGSKAGKDAVQNPPDKQKQQENNQAQQENNKGEQENEGDVFPLKVTDAMGNEITISKKPENIVSLFLASDEILMSITDRENIKALSHISKSDGISNIADQVEGIQTVETNAEVVISLKPDLVFVSNLSDQDFVKHLKDAQIPVYIYQIPVNIEQVKSLVKELAYVIGETDKGQEVISWMDEILNEVRSKTGSLPEEEKVRALALDAFFYTYGKGSTFDSIAEHAGVINLASANGMEMWQEISKEQVVKLNPDVILLPSWSFEGFDAAEYAENFRNDPSLADVSAVKDGRVFTLPEEHMTACSHYIVLGVKDLAEAAYPDLFN